MIEVCRRTLWKRKCRWHFLGSGTSHNAFDHDVLLVRVGFFDGKCFESCLDLKIIQQFGNVCV